MGADELSTTYLSKACGGHSSMRMYILRPTAMDTRCIKDWIVTSATIIVSGSIPHWANRPQQRCLVMVGTTGINRLPHKKGGNSKR